MMTEQRERELIRRAIDQRFSGMQANPWLADRIIQIERGEIKLKKKISVGLILVIILALAAATGLAVAISGYFDGFANLENTYGDYEQWPESAKVNLLNVMIEDGVIGADQIKTWQADMDDGDREKLAGSILERHFSDMAVIDTYNVMEKDLGESDEWSLEEKAMYTSLQKKYGVRAYLEEQYILPGSEDLTEEAAVAKAMEYAHEQHGLSAQDVSSTWTSFYYLESAPAVKMWKIRFNVKAPGYDSMYTLSSRGDLMDTWISDTESRLGAPENIDNEALKEVVKSRPVIIATEFLSGIVDVTWFDFDYNWFPNLILTTVEGFGDGKVWSVTYRSPTMEDEFRVVVSQDEKILAWALPGQGYTSIMPDDIDTLLSEAQIFKPAQYGLEADVMRLAGAVLQDRLNLSCEQAALYRQELYLIQHPKYADGKAPVWLVMHYDNQNELAFKTLYTNGAELIAFALPGIEFTDTVR